MGSWGEVLKNTTSPKETGKVVWPFDYRVLASALLLFLSLVRFGRFFAHGSPFYFSPTLTHSPSLEIV